MFSYSVRSICALGSIGARAIFAVIVLHRHRAGSLTSSLVIIRRMLPSLHTGSGRGAFWFRVQGDPGRTTSLTRCATRPSATGSWTSVTSSSARRGMRMHRSAKRTVGLAFFATASAGPAGPVRARGRIYRSRLLLRHRPPLWRAIRRRRVRRRDLDGAPGTGALGRDPMSAGRDVVVEFAEDEPARHRAPQCRLVRLLGTRRPPTFAAPRWRLEPAHAPGPRTPRPALVYRSPREPVVALRTARRRNSDGLAAGINRLLPETIIASEQVSGKAGQGPAMPGMW